MCRWMLLLATLGIALGTTQALGQVDGPGQGSNGDDPAVRALAGISQGNAEWANWLSLEIPGLVAAGQWQQRCRGFFAGEPLTPNLVSFWRSHVLAAAMESRAVAVDALFVVLAEALAADLAEPAGRLGSLQVSLGWVEEAAAQASDYEGAALARHLALAFKGRPGDLRTALGGVAPEAAVAAAADTQAATAGKPAQSAAVRVAPAVRYAAMQACLSLARFADGKTLCEWLRLPAAVATFLKNTGVFLFDGGVLNVPQTTSLDSLYAAVPARLRPVSALLVAEGVGFGAAESGLAAAGMVLDVQPVSMALLSDRGEFSPAVGQPAAPEFVLSAAVTLMGAIQYGQFQARPELVLRRDAILDGALRFGKVHARPSVNPSIYGNNRDALLPLAGYLWFLDSARCFGMAVGGLEGSDNGAIETVLLLADTLSLGGDTTLLFQTDASGRVTSTETALRRSMLPSGLVCANGLGVGGELWEFVPDATGAIVRYVRHP